jgi:hypothetical protein
LERRDDLSRRQHSIFTVSVKIQRGGNLTETNRRAGSRRPWFGSDRMLAGSMSAPGARN